MDDEKHMRGPKEVSKGVEPIGELQRALAEVLQEARRKRCPVTPLTADYPELEVVDAYAIQRLGRELRIAGGDRLVGRKVGLTSVAMQTMLGVDQPDFGYLTESMISESGARLSPRALDLIAPRVEAEIAFRLREPLSVESISRESVLQATAEVAPALEIIDSRTADWKITIVDTIADNASSAHVVLGAFRDCRDLDLAAVEMKMTVVRNDGEAESVCGRGEAVLGHPADAVAWLVRALADLGSEEISAGEIVIPGAMARAVAVGPSARVSAWFSDLGEVSVEFEED